MEDKWREIFIRNYTEDIRRYLLESLPFLFIINFIQWQPDNSNCHLSSKILIDYKRVLCSIFSPLSQGKLSSPVFISNCRKNFSLKEFFLEARVSSDSAGAVSIKELLRDLQLMKKKSEKILKNSYIRYFLIIKNIY